MSDFFKGTVNILGSNSSSAGSFGAGSYQTAIDNIYKLSQPDNWYKSKPYGFVFFDRGVNSTNFTGTGRITFWLPINPSDITVQTHFATNIVTTLYGVVEEHSDIRYYDITISGTTGYSPNYFSHMDASTTKDPTSTFKSAGRESYQAGFLEKISLPGGIGAGAIGAVQQIAGSVTDAVTEVTGGSASKTGVKLNQSGYVAFHNFYRFLLNYKKDGAGLGGAGFTKRKVHPLQFLNYKDGIKYDCIPIGMTLKRSSDNPMLYVYNIKMRCFNLRDVTANPGGISTQDDLLAKLGLSQGIFDQFNSGLAAVGNAVGAISSLF